MVFLRLPSFLQGLEHVVDKPHPKKLSARINSSGYNKIAVGGNEVFSVHFKERSSGEHKYRRQNNTMVDDVTIRFNDNDNADPFAKAEVFLLADL